MDVASANSMTEKLDASHVRLNMESRQDWGRGRTKLHSHTGGDQGSKEYWIVSIEGKVVGEIFDKQVLALLEDAMKCAVIMKSYGLPLDPAALLLQMKQRA